MGVVRVPLNSTVTGGGDESGWGERITRGRGGHSDGMKEVTLRWVPREGLGEGRRRQKVTELVVTKRWSWISFWISFSWTFGSDF